MKLTITGMIVLSTVAIADPAHAARQPDMWKFSAPGVLYAQDIKAERHFMQKVSRGTLAAIQPCKQVICNEKIINAAMLRHARKRHDFIAGNMALQQLAAIAAYSHPQPVWG